MTSATSSTSDPFELLGKYYRCVSAVRLKQDLATISLPTSDMIRHAFVQARAHCTHDPVALRNARIVCNWTLAGLERIDNLRKGILTQRDPNHPATQRTQLKRTAEQAFGDTSVSAPELKAAAHDLLNQGHFLGSLKELHLVVKTQMLQALTSLDLRSNTLIKPLDLDKIPHLLPHLKILKLPPRLASGTILVAFISLFRALTVLDISGSTKLTQLSISAISRLTKLQQLILARTNVQDNWLEELSQLPKLTSLDLSQTDVTHAGLDGLEGLTHLKELLLSGCKSIDRGCIGQLGSLPNLERLDLNRSALDDDSVPLLKFARSLTCLNLVRTPLTGEGFAHLSTLINLRELNLSGTPLPPTAFGPLKHMRQMKKLHLTCAPADDVSEVLAHISQLTLLEELCLYNCPANDAQVDALTRALPHLKKIHIGSADITDVGLSCFGRLQNLEELSLFGGCFTGAGLFALTTLKLRSLILKGADITEQGLQAIGQLRLLEKLHIVPHEDKEIVDNWTPLNNLRALQELNLSKIQNPPIDIIVRLTNLRRLMLNECDLDPCDLHGIEKLQKLQELSLATNSLTEAVFEHLEPLNALQRLDLSCNSIDTLEDRLTLSVRVINLEHCPLEGSTLRNLNLPQVNQIRISDAPLLQNSDVLELLRCMHLESLIITNCNQINGDIVPRFKKAGVEITIN